jgi:rfaE bifunctional protein kinase chain/domain
MKRVLVYGDAMVDRYEIVTPTKVSAEAPVLVCRQVDKPIYRPGGAANVAMNLRALGATVTLLSYASAAEDHDKWLVEELEKDGIVFMAHHGHATPLKTRIVDHDYKQLLRLDREDSNIDPEIARHMLVFIERYIQDFDVLCISDYDKGLATHGHLRKAIDIAKANKVYTICNIKPDNIWLSEYSDLVVLNFGEAVASLTVMSAKGDEPRGLSLQAVGLALQERLDGPDILITSGEKGMYLFKPNGVFHHIKAYPVQVADITGAGDTVVATIAAHGQHTLGVLDLAAKNAAEVVTKQGVATPS